MPLFVLVLYKVKGTLTIYDTRWLEAVWFYGQSKEEKPNSFKFGKPNLNSYNTVRQQSDLLVQNDQ
jgi:hypothetical protein